ncbi:stalk domain-containing protein [Paenibacillus sp. LHD-38]|uniref:stalk domain-containing protein n=1 Tax=Paenibacillus sp. LHD-38 TaxID=3072143 RepID=UPI00280E0F01|nr:stalk domain-containing protein [Paenibacillus sp. LHD-38]MDQ8738891.1 stalk domain-containing protein [Paenibacillus sp. LHD-38]
MIKLKFRVFSLFLSLLIAIVSVPLVATAAATPIKVVLDGIQISFDVQPQVINGTTMVPYSAITSKFGAVLSFDAKTKKLKVTRNKTTVELTINSNKATVNGQAVKLPVNVVEKNGRTLVPLRFLGESFGLWVNWNAGARTVKIDTKRTIKHAMGETTLTSVPKRVVVLFNGMVDISLTLGVKPIGAVESWVQAPWYHYLRADMAGVKNLGSELQPNIEAIVALKPDLIIGAKPRHEKIYGQLSKIAPTLYVDQLFEWKTNMDIASKALNKEDNATAFMSDWNKRVANFKAKVGSQNAEVSIVRFYDDNSARIYISGFAGTILQELGLKRPKAQQSPDKVFVDLASQEQIPLIDGDIIFDITSSNGGGDEFKTQAEWQKNPLWNNLKAVKNGKYYKVNDITWNMSGGATAAKMMLDDLYFYFDI